jgi:hypothetical protein
MFNTLCPVLLSSERLGKSCSPIDVANLMEKCIRINYLCVTYTVYAWGYTVYFHGLCQRIHANHHVDWAGMIPKTVEGAATYKIASSFTTKAVFLVV